MPLPIYDLQNDFRDAYRRGDNCVISAPTGSGKSTQIPKFILGLLRPGHRAVILQPRRLPARMCAERVAEELNEAPGETVGYITRFEHTASPATRLLFITEGILVRMLMNPDELRDTDAIVFDEFHERSIHADLGLALARRLQRESRPDLRLIVMSATLAADAVAGYLPPCTRLETTGRLFPVTITYTNRSSKLNIYQSAANALKEIASSNPKGDFLIFMPGAAEIHHCITECQMRCGTAQFRYFPLYGEMNADAQHDVMRPLDSGNGMRKVIVATNIAETSLTVPGVMHVIDSGLVKINRYDAVRGVNLLELRPISNDSANQRAGRAGRLAPGTCRRLWSELEQNGRAPHTIPEIQRIDLCDAMLTLHASGCHDYRDFEWFEMPPEKMAEGAESLLTMLGLIADGCLTDTGRRVRQFPLHPRLGLLLQLGAENGCFPLACQAAAILSERPLMLNAAGNREQLTEYRGNLRRDMRKADIPASDFFGYFDLLHQAGQRHFEAAACQQLGIHGGAARDICRAAADYLRLAPKNSCRQENSPLQGKTPEESFLKCLLAIFPDRLLRRLDQGATLACELQGRRRAVLSPVSLARSELLAVAGEIRENASGGTVGIKMELSLVSGIREEWLWDIFPDDFEDTDDVFWDSVHQQVMRRRILSCRNLVLEEKIQNNPDPELASDLLCKQLEANNMPLLGWDDACTAWIDRVKWLAEVFPEQALPDYSDDDVQKIRRDICRGETAYRAIKNKPCLQAVRNLLPQNQIAFVERMAPTFLPLPRGRKLRNEYHPGQTPRGRARIQELYDLEGPITIAGGRVSLLLDILAPNMRTVQITDDLPRFWKVHYPAMKNALSRRYPKHEWR